MIIKPIESIDKHQERVWSVAWNPKGNLFASCGGDKNIKIWGQEGERWVCKSTLSDQHKRTVRSVSWSPCGNLLAAASFDSTVSVWDKSGGGDFDCIATLEGHENEVKCVDWSVSGSFLATCSRDKSVWVWEVADDDYECASVLNKHTQDVKKVVWHPHLDVFASCSYDDTVSLFKEEDDDWTCYDTLSGHMSTVWSISFDKTGDRLVSCSDDGSLKIWQCYYPDNKQGVPTIGGDPAWKCVCTLSGYHNRAIYDVDWNKETGLILTAGGDNSVKVFKEDLSRGDKDAPVFDCVVSISASHFQDVNCVRWNPADPSLFVSCSDDMNIKLWKIEHEG